MSEQLSLHELAKVYGFKLRSSLDGYFIGELDFKDPNRTTDDMMSISHKGEVTVYVHNANAFLAATIIAKAIQNGRT